MVTPIIAMRRTPHPDISQQLRYQRQQITRIRGHPRAQDFC